MTIPSAAQPFAARFDDPDLKRAGASSLGALEMRLREVAREDAFWRDYLVDGFLAGSVPYAVHLAVLLEPYLQYVLDGRKTVESRFSQRRFAPYGCVQPGDVLLLKRSKGPILGLCRVQNAWFYHLDPNSWETVRTEFTAALCAQDPAFWEQRRLANFASLMRVEHVRAMAPIHYAKRDRRGWVVLSRGAPLQQAFGLR